MRRFLRGLGIFLLFVLAGAVLTSGDNPGVNALISVAGIVAAVYWSRPKEPDGA